jgi:DNA-binding transcriptional regulator PaaX
VWITPDSLEKERGLFAGCHPDAASLVCLESRPCGGETDAEVVTSAWDFEAINRGYRDHLDVLARFPDVGVLDARTARLLQDWGRTERETWMHAVCKDPLLPEPLLPGDYLGREAWKRRQRVLAEAGKRISEFTWPKAVQPFAPDGAKGSTEN